MITSPWRKSSRSGGNGAASNCVEVRGVWRKSSRSNGAGAQSNCVEARLADGSAQIRDSKLGDNSPILSLTATDFAALLTSLK